MRDLIIEVRLLICEWLLLLILRIAPTTPDGDKLAGLIYTYVCRYQINKEGGK